MAGVRRSASRSHQAARSSVQRCSSCFRSRPRPAPEAERLAGLGIQAGMLLPLATYYCLVNPWLEEVIWRGRLGSGHPLPNRWDLAFAGYHALVLAQFVTLGWTLVAVAALAVVAWLWRRLSSRAGGLAMPAVAHATANVSLMWATLRLVG